MQPAGWGLHDRKEEGSITKKICKNYVLADKNTVQKRIARLDELGYFLKNRSPDPEEIKLCTPYLDKQIMLIKPKVICALGNFACSYIFEKFGLKYDKISNVHGKLFQINTIFGNVKIIPMYHPAVATYNPYTKDTLLADFKMIKKAIERN
jgi:uracil-DNA glycosylase